MAEASRFGTIIVEMMWHDDYHIRCGNHAENTDHNTKLYLMSCCIGICSTCVGVIRPLNASEATHNNIAKHLPLISETTRIAGVLLLSLTIAFTKYACQYTQSTELGCDPLLTVFQDVLCIPRTTGGYTLVVWTWDVKETSSMYCNLFVPQNY